MQSKATKKKRSAKANQSPLTSQTRPTKCKEETTGHLRLRQKSDQALNEKGESSSPANAARCEDRERPQEAIRQTQEELKAWVEARTAQLTESNTRLEQKLVERRRIEDSLREGEERFRTFLDHAPNVACMKTRDGRYLFVNRRFEKVFGLEQASTLGRTDAELFPREQAYQFQANDRQVLERGEAMEFEETALYGDRSPYHYCREIPGERWLRTDLRDGWHCHRHHGTQADGRVFARARSD
jgi:PAS domain S-box-containing protein